MPLNICGWIPSNPQGDVVDVPPSQASGQLTFRLSPPDPSVPLPSSSWSAPTPPESLCPTNTEPTAVRIPRPRNPFIIFRTEFSRLRLHRARGPRYGAAEPLGRTVSRKAADVWHTLPLQEKQYYQRLAQLEKERHARDYPDYQYRPRRREGPRRPPAAAKRRHASPAPTIRPTGSDSETAYSPPTDAAHSPPTDSEYPPSTPETVLQPQMLDPNVKAGRRRSSSVPVTAGEHLFAPTGWDPNEACRWERQERWERPHQARRRSRSVNQDWASMLPSFQAPSVQALSFQAQLFQSLSSLQEPAPAFQEPEPVCFDPRSPKLRPFSPTNIYPFEIQSPKAHLDTPPALFPPKHMSPLTAVASTLSGSSLAGWNGEPAPVAPKPVRLHTLPMPWLTSESDPIALKFEPGSPGFDVKQLTPLAGDFGDFSWPPTDPYVFDQGAVSPIYAKLSEHTEDYATAQALQEYQLGLDARVDCSSYFESEVRHC